MELAEGIRRHGFRKWYERELLRSHAHLAAVIVCTLGLMMALEASTRFRSIADQLTDLVAIAVCAGAGLWALRRYLYLLMRAEAIAHQADCPRCQTYGRLDLVNPPSSGGTLPAETADGLTVRCRACKQVWQIHS
jgi:phage FluMu protein Com